MFYFKVINNIIYCINLFILIIFSISILIPRFINISNTHTKINKNIGNIWAYIINNVTNNKIQNNVKFKYATTSMNNISKLLVVIIEIAIVVMLILTMI